MKVIRRLIVIFILTMIFGLIIKRAHAGMFLDLDVGAHLTDWPDPCYCHNERELSSANPIFVGRLGYQTDPVSQIMRFQVFYEHMSSAGDGRDTGIDVLMIGVRIE